MSPSTGGGSGSASCLCRLTILWGCLCLSGSKRICTTAYEHGSHIRGSEIRHFVVVIVSWWWSIVYTVALEVLAVRAWASGQPSSLRAELRPRSREAADLEGSLRSPWLNLIKSTLDFHLPPAPPTQRQDLPLSDSVSSRSPSYAIISAQMRGQGSSRGRKTLLQVSPGEQKSMLIISFITAKCIDCTVVQ